MPIGSGGWGQSCARTTQFSIATSLSSCCGATSPLEPQPERSHEGVRGRSPIRLVTNQDPIRLLEVRQLATKRSGDMIKRVADLARGVLLLDTDMHADQEARLLSDGSHQQDSGERFEMSH